MENKSKRNIILLVIIVILLIVVSGYLFIKNSTTPTSKLDNECPESINDIKIFDLVINNSGLLEAQGYYKILPTEYEDINFDETVSCRLSLSKMVVLEPYEGGEIKRYEYTEFSKLNTWENYLLDRTKKTDCVTNVFSITKTNNVIILDELYQE